MLIAVARETRDGEARVAMVPDLVARLAALGWQVAVQPGAGRAAGIADDQYGAVGATLDEQALPGADLVVSVQPLNEGLRRSLRPGTATLSFLPAAESLSDVVARRDARLTSFAMELVPRISRAQSMDALTSQALVTGYRGAVVAAGLLRRFFPLSMTAAGTVPPAQVMVLGAGVAGLQAIATCRRLGAVVKAYDVRPTSAEEIRSVGATAIELDLETLAGAGGYAREMTAERADRQQQLLSPYVAAADALITTAAVPGRRSPVLVTAGMVEQMRPGSVVVDLAADSGGNVEGTVAGSVVRIGQVQVWGGANVPSQMPGPASRLYAQNLLNVIELMTSDGTFAPDFSDEVVAAMCVTHAGHVRHRPTAALLGEDVGDEDTQGTGDAGEVTGAGTGAHSAAAPAPEANGSASAAHAIGRENR